MNKKRGKTWNFQAFLRDNEQKEHQCYYFEVAFLETLFLSQTAQKTFLCMYVCTYADEVGEVRIFLLFSTPMQNNDDDVDRVFFPSGDLRNLGIFSWERFFGEDGISSVCVALWDSFGKKKIEFKNNMNI